MPLHPNDDPREEILEADRLVTWTSVGVPIVPPYAWYRLARAAVLALIKLSRDSF